MTPDGAPVLFAYDCDLPRIRRFDTALRLQDRYGILIASTIRPKCCAATAATGLLCRPLILLRSRGGFSRRKKETAKSAIRAPAISGRALFGGGYLSQFVRNYQQWKDAGGTPGDGSSPAAPVLSLSACCEALLSKSGIIGVGLCLLLLGLLIVMVMRMGYSDVGEYDCGAQPDLLQQRHLRNGWFHGESGDEGRP